jgi:hypothetical protein
LISWHRCFAATSQNREIGYSASVRIREGRTANKAVVMAIYYRTELSVSRP